MVSPEHLGGQVVRLLVGIGFCTLLTCCGDRPTAGVQSGLLATTLASSTTTSTTSVASSTTTSTTSVASSTTTSTTSVASSTTTSTTTLPLPRGRIPTVDDPLRVLVLGDSATYEIEPGLTAALEHTGLVDSTDWTQMGLGLSRWPELPWWEAWAGYVAEIRPDAVVLQVGIWDVEEGVFSGTRRPVPTDSDWEQQFAFLMDVAVEVLTVDGADLYWLTMLPEPPDAASPERLNRLVVELANRDERVSVVDLTPAFSRDGEYVRVVERNGVVWPIRKVDGVHLCREGAGLAGRVVAEAIAADHGVIVDVGWEDGAWRSNPKFDVDPCSDPLPPDDAS